LSILRKNRNPITFIHTADFHFPGSRNSSDPYDREPEKSPFKALEVLVATANRENVDLVVLAGDLFETFRPEIEVISFVIEQFRKLIPPVVLIPGNHDCHGVSEAFNNPVWEETEQGFYLITDLTGEIIQPPGIPVKVWGKAMQGYMPEFQPLEGLPEPDEQTWNIILGHGIICHETESYMNTFPIHTRQIRESGWDYIALGHEHHYKDVSQGGVRTFYSGSPTDTWGPTPGLIHVTLDMEADDKVSVKRLPLA
jgi:exonuclease SbcD